MLQLCPDVDAAVLENSVQLSKSYKYFVLRIAPNYVGKNYEERKEVDEYINKMYIERDQISQTQDFSIYGKKPTIDVLE